MASWKFSICYPFKCLLYVPRGVTFSNSTFCPHSVLMCFVWIWEQTVIISLYSINWLVFITKMDCVYCAVQTGCLWIVHLNFCLWRFSCSFYTCPHIEIHTNTYKIIITFVMCFEFWQNILALQATSCLFITDTIFVLVIHKISCSQPHSSLWDLFDTHWNLVFHRHYFHLLVSGLCVLQVVLFVIIT